MFEPRMFLVPLLLVLCSARLAQAQDAASAPERPERPAQLTVADVFRLEEELKPKNPESLGWLDAKSWIVHDTPEGGERKQILVVDAPSGKTRPLFDPIEMEKAFSKLPGIGPKRAREWSQKKSYHFSKAKDAVLLNENGDLFYYDFGRSRPFGLFGRSGEPRAVRLTSDPQSEIGETISPDGRLVAYVSDDNLHVVGTDGGRPRQLTEGGHPNLLMGRLDWVYQEEVYGRGNWQGYWWSPDSSRLVFLSLDESPVPQYTIVDHRKARPEVEIWRYPKAGDPNPKVRVGVVEAGGGEITWVDLSRYELQDFLVVRAGFTPDSKQVVLQIQDRIQTWLDLVLADPDSGEIKRLFRDSTGVWIEPTDAPFWSGDGRYFLWLSERSGYRHLYLYRRDGTLVRALTSGEWEVDQVHSVLGSEHSEHSEGSEDVEAVKGLVFFSGDRADVKGQKLFAVPLEGGEPTVLTPKDGTHSISMSPDSSYFLDRYSSISDPGWNALYGRDGKLVRVLGESQRSLLQPYGLPIPEFVQVETRDGFVMEAMLLKPADFDPKVKYPIFCYTYSGPHAPQVRDRFSTRNMLWHQLLSQRGYLVWICDNRSASGKGLESVKGIYRNLGAQELSDLEEGLDWLVAQGFANPERIGMFGWSYGGYMTSYALTHSRRFKLGIAGAPVTDWRLYDTIYTERYMDTPQNNPEGYDRSSVLKAAGELSGKLLLIHGMVDENVHLQNSAQFIEALQKAGKQFDLMIYPGNRHGVVEKAQQRHLYTLMTDFIVNHL